MSLTSGGLPNTNNYVIGRGIMRFDLFDESGNASGRYRDLGNATAFGLNLEEEILDHEASLAGLKKIDASVTLSKSLKGTFILDELTSENQQLFYSGDLIERAQATLSRDGASVENEINLVVVRDSAGHWMPLYYDTDTGAPVPRFDVRGTKLRGYRVTIDRVDINLGASDLVRGTDWELDEDAGLFQPLKGGALDLGSDTDVELDIAFAALSDATGKNNKIREIRPLERTVVRGRLLFVGENAQTGEKVEIFLNKVKLQADGDNQFIGDDFSELPFALTAEADDALAPTGRITRIPLLVD